MTPLTSISGVLLDELRSARNHLADRLRNSGDGRTVSNSNFQTSAGGKGNDVGAIAAIVAHQPRLFLTVGDRRCGHLAPRQAKRRVCQLAALYPQGRIVSRCAPVLPQEELARWGI